MAQGTDASLIPTTGPGAIGHLEWYSTTTQSVAFAGSSSTAPVDVVSDPSPPLTSLDLDGVRYFQIYGNVVASIGGRISATYALPTLQPDPLAGGFPLATRGSTPAFQPARSARLFRHRAAMSSRSLRQDLHLL